MFKGLCKQFLSGLRNLTANFEIPSAPLCLILYDSSLIERNLLGERAHPPTKIGLADNKDHETQSWLRLNDFANDCSCSPMYQKGTGFKLEQSNGLVHVL